MTEATPLASEQITQEDREAAASNIKRRLVWQHGGEQQWMDASTASMQMGEQDGHAEVQAFARHRIAALSASPAPSGISVGLCHCVGLGLPNSSCPDCKGSGSKEPVEQSWTGDPHGLANELRRVANSFGAGFRLTQLLRDAADEIGCLTTQIASPAPSGQGVSGEVREAMPACDERQLWDDAAPYGYRESDTEWLARNWEVARWLVNNHAAIRASLAAPAPSCAPGEVERLAIWGGVNEHDRMHGGGYFVRWPGYGYKSPTFSDSDAAYAELARLRAAAILAALSPQGLDAKEGGE